ncbi:hypothetical protein BGX28_000555 [Mortierella sp. GBA30]|nr:hypothetical protein BGX28_000555 [Mortierella sp. GBA30]
MEIAGLMKNVATASLEEGEEEEEEAALLYALVSSSRYSPLVRSSHYFPNVFPLISEDEFHKMFRTTRMGFMGILKEMENGPVFLNNSTCSQVLPIYQLAVDLSGFGANGNGAGVYKMRAIFGVLQIRE